MKKYIPKMYQKSIFDVPYSKLKSLGIRCLIFDIDNTIAKIDEEVPNQKTTKWMQKLKKEFTVILISNNTKGRVAKVAEHLQVDYISLAMKPSTSGLSRIKRKYGFEKSQMAMIGDQLFTDIVAGNRYRILTILVDPTAKEDLKITSLNRKLEVYVMNKKGTRLKRGKFYE